MNTFDKDTAVSKQAEGLYTASLPESWNVILGPNGGYLMAIVLRAMRDTVADDSRVPRSLTIHYLSVPGNESLEIRTTVERAGRSMTTVSVRFLQGERLIGIGTGAFAKPREGIVEFNDMPMPETPAAEALEPYHPFGQGHGPIFLKHYEFRRTMGDEAFSGGERALTGGWIRLSDHRRPDALSVAAITDCWPPAFFVRSKMPVPAPTIDLTVHFRTDIDALQLPDDAWVHARFETRYAHEGYIEEDAVIWAEDGTVLAHSRQLGLCEPLKR